MTLKAENIRKSFGEKEVLKGIDFSAESGAVMGILGRNGAGKTTLIRIIMKVFPPDSGRVLLSGEPLDTKKIRIGYLPEERGLFPKKLISEQLAYISALKGLSCQEAKKSINFYMERLEMSEYLNKRLDTLSKGNQQKIQLAATLLGDPDIVILDEPFSGLDPVNAMMLKEIVRECIVRGRIVIFSSHQMNYIEEFCDSIMIINGGNQVLSGGIREIKRSYERNKLLVSGPDMDNLRRESEKLDSVLSCSCEKEELTVTLKAASRKNEFITALVSAGAELDEIRVKEPTLNDIFVEYTEGGI